MGIHQFCWAMQAVCHTSGTVRAAGFSLISSGQGRPPDWQVASIIDALEDTEGQPVRSAACKASAHLLVTGTLIMPGQLPGLLNVVIEHCSPQYAPA